MIKEYCDFCDKETRYWSYVTVMNEFTGCEMSRVACDECADKLEKKSKG